MPAWLRIPSKLLRWAGGIGVACALLTLLVLGPITSSRHGKATADSTYRVDVIFDTAKGIIPGQLVKIAGARVGTIKDVVLTPDFKARIQMEIDRRFAPFRKDAKCEIQPEGLISERFVQCDPGTAAAGELVPKGDEAATVPVTNTSVPIAITDLFNIFRVPVRQRLSVVLTTLGISVAGRGEDINEVLRRANPALALTRKALTILGDQKQALGDTVVAVDKVSADLAAHPASVSNFLDEAAKVTTTTADHRTALAEAIKRLPGLLDQTEPTLKRLDEASAAGTPVLRDLRAATPALSSLVDTIPTFANAAKPALSHLATAAQTGRKTVKAARPVVRLLKTFAAAAGPTGTSLNQLLVSLQDRGGAESLLSFIYGAASAISRYDSISHLLPAHIIVNKCSAYTAVPVDGCAATFGPTTATTATRAGKPAATKLPAVSVPATTTTTPPATTAPAATTTTTTTPATPAGPTIQLPGLPPIKLPSLPGILGGQGQPGKSGSSDPTADLLQYLLGQ